MIQIPYGHQIIDDDDIAAMADVLKSDFLTTGPQICEFEAAVAGYCGAAYGVAVNSGTAALHCAIHALGIGPGDEVVVPPMTFAASANVILYCGATPVFADVDPDTLLIDSRTIERKLTSRTKAVIGVDYAGQPCDWDALRTLADTHSLVLIEDACHALGALYKGRKVGTLADITCFSFHPVKHITTGEGGMALTDDENLAEAMRIFRSHGISVDSAARERGGTWFYEMVELGFNYRITDIQCALGVSQLRKLPRWLDYRKQVASYYTEKFRNNALIRPLLINEGVEHAWHLYVIRVPSKERARIFSKLRNIGIGVNVHYIPVYLHPYYHKKLGIVPGTCPAAEAAYQEIISLPIWPGLQKKDVDFIVNGVLNTVEGQT